jgi:hypothetical protein
MRAFEILDDLESHADGDAELLSEIAATRREIS